MASLDTPQKGQSAFKSRTEYDLDNLDDKKVVREFEAEIQPFMSRSIEVFGRVLSRFELYLHEKQLLRYTEKYPYGAVNANRLHEFHEANMKWQALQKLWDRRDFAEKQESEHIEQIAATA